MSRLLLWLFVINLGIALGAGLYEHRIVVPDWITWSGSERHWDGAIAQHDDTGRRFWVFVTTIPLTLLTIANLLAAWWSAGAARPWWLTAAALALLDRIVTFGYFIPTMVGLTGMPDSPESAARAVQWSALNHLRHAIVLAAWLSALKTFSLTSSSQGEQRPGGGLAAGRSA